MKEVEDTATGSPFFDFRFMPLGIICGPGKRCLARHVQDRARDIFFFFTTRSFFEAVALCTFVLHVCASFWSSFLFLKPNFFLLLHDGEFDLIRRAHLLCVLKRHHTYGVNTFVCSYSLNSNPSHFLVLSSLLDWQPYLLCGVSNLNFHSRAFLKNFFFKYA